MNSFLKIFSYLFWKIISGTTYKEYIKLAFDEPQKSEPTRRIMAIHSVAIVSIIFIISYAIAAYISGDITFLIINLSAVIVIALMATIAHITKLNMLASSIMLAVIIGLFFYSFLEGGIYNFGYLWLYSIPFISLFLKGFRKGGIIVLSVVLIIISVALLPWINFPGKNQPGFVFCLLTSLVSVYIGFYVIDFFRYESEQAISKKNNELINMLESLNRSKWELKISEEKYRTILERAHEGIVIIQDGKVAYVNQSAATMGGYSIDELIDKPFTKFVDQSQMAKLVDYYERRIKGLDVPKQYETVLIGKNGQKLEVEISGGLITYQDYPADLVFIRNISERKRTEREKEQLQEQLRQSQKLEAIGQLAGGIAHDFNNILGGIKGMAYVLKKENGGTNSRIKEYATTIIEASDKAADLIAKLLAFARKGKYQIVSVDIHQIIDDTIKLLEHTMVKTISIEKKFKAQHAIVMGEPSQLQNAILNIAVNARDAMPMGGKITFTTDLVSITKEYLDKNLHEASAGSFIRISITDTGIGMDNDTLKRIFEPFFTTKKITEGTGLGLASVYGTIKSHQGFIEVKSELGKGTTFNLFLPLAQAANFQLGQQEQSTTDDIITGSGTVMIIDDENFVRKACEQLLVVLGYKTVSFEDATQAIEYYKNNTNNIDIILLDIIMPKITGYECFLKLRQINKNAKILLTSGYAIDEGTRKILQNGAIGFLQKPFDIKKLSEILSKYKEIKKRGK